MKKTNYNDIASKFDERYDANKMSNVFKAIQKLINKTNPNNILEMGCGTGYWLDGIKNNRSSIYGIDNSIGMLQQAKGKKRTTNLINADAHYVPLKSNSIELLLYINSIHHFGNIKSSLKEAQRLLKAGSMIVILTMFPEQKKYRWYINEYFDGIKAYDLKRFPAKSELKKILAKLRFNTITEKVLVHITDTYIGSEVFEDPFLQKHNSSQLASLSDEEYSEGISKIKEAIKISEKSSNTIMFRTELDFWMITAKLSK
jgi:ubiquinone/menaquinone biosynthesis C-methylase UbiE